MTCLIAMWSFTVVCATGFRLINNRAGQGLLSNILTTTTPLR